MRKLALVTALLLLAGFSFAQVSNTSSLDMKAEEAALRELMNKFEAVD